MEIISLEKLEGFWEDFKKTGITRPVYTMKKTCWRNIVSEKVLIDQELMF